MARRRALHSAQLALCRGLSLQLSLAPSCERSLPLHLLAPTPIRAPGSAAYSGCALQQPRLQPASHSYGFAAEAVVHADAESEVYRLKVVTGNLRGAGTPSVATLQLIGTNGASQKVLIGSDELGTLDRGSTRTVDVLWPKSFGSVRRVYVEKKDRQLSGDGWFLKHVEVSAPSGESTLFPCAAWLGDSDCGGYNGPQERNLLPAVPSLAADFPTPVKVRASGIAIPHPEKVLKAKLKGHNTRGFGYGGEDSYYYVDNGKGLFSMGVADGIYMWRESGIDSGIMSRALMERCQAQVAEGEEDVFKILHRAVDHIQSAQLQGSATVSLITINQGTGQLHSANLGDSGFLVFTPSHGLGYDLKFRTNQLEHSFGCPYQIGHHANANKVEDSDLASFHVLPGDIIVMGSDGLLDNVADLDMAREVALMVRQNASPSQMAQRLTKMAFDASMDKRKVTPYSKGASEAFDMVYSGGKPDDITVMVALCS